MKVSELGEFGLLDLLAKMVTDSRDNSLGAWQQLVIGIGDDAAVWHGDSTAQLATVDSLIQDIHFSLDITSWQQLGWKALAVNLSDIAAMGGVPRYALVSIALPDHTEVADVTALYRGMIELAQQSGVAVVGGDTSSAPLVTITVAVLGSVSWQDKHILARSGAMPGEQIAVTGYLGTAAAGWEMLTRRLQFDPEVATGLKQAFLHPQPRIAEGQLLVEQGIKTAIDISDGLISDLGQICKASQVSARIEAERVPILPAVKASFGDQSSELALTDGEDYELLFTGSAETVDRVSTAASCPVTVIGEITAAQPERIRLVDNSGNPVKLSKAGWEHFTTR